jgi:fructose-specific component phosphotransferase system IIB-like protein
MRPARIARLRMQNESDNLAASNGEPAAIAGDTMPPRPKLTGRRDFIVGVGKKAAYITPIVLTLTAAPAVASPHAASCKPAGQPCTRNPSCCSNVCGNAVPGVCD